MHVPAQCDRTFNMLASTNDLCLAVGSGLDTQYRLYTQHRDFVPWYLFVRIFGAVGFHIRILHSLSNIRTPIRREWSRSLCYVHSTSYVHMLLNRESSARVRYI